MGRGRDEEDLWENREKGQLWGGNADGGSWAGRRRSLKNMYLWRGRKIKTGTVGGKGGKCCTRSRLEAEGKKNKPLKVEKKKEEQRVGSARGAPQLPGGSHAL